MWGIVVFRGCFEHTIDEKGRLAIPSRFRQDLLVHGEDAPLIVTRFHQCLAAYPLNEWEQLEAKIEALPQFDPKVVAFKRYFLSAAAECPVDKAGRILVPNNLRQGADLSHECVVVGQLRRFEIWSKTAWERENAGLADQFFSITGSLAESGIKL